MQFLNTTMLNKNNYIDLMQLVAQQVFVKLECQVHCTYTDTVRGVSHPPKFLKTVKIRAIL